MKFTYPITRYKLLAIYPAYPSTNGAILSKGNLFIGTSGYSYTGWRGVFYPLELKENKWLEYYTNFFDSVELNITFYRLPQEKTFLGWHKRTPDDFKFAVKGSRFITHIKRLKSCKGPLKLFFSRVRFLKEKLGPFLWQLPPSLKVNPKILETFLVDLKKHKNIRHVFEFRNKTWFSDDIFKILKSHNASICSADWPDFCKDIHGTSDFIYIRRHGYGRSLYGGSYPDKVLKCDAEVIKKHLKEKRDVYIYFNNDVCGYAVKNAIRLNDMLSKD